MKKGDKVFYYHTGKEKAIVGTAKVVPEPRPDPKDSAGKQFVVELEPGKKLPRPVTLAEVKAAASSPTFRCALATTVGHAGDGGSSGRRLS